MKSSSTISAKRVGVGAASQRAVQTREPSGFANAHRDDGKRFVARANEELTAFIELESAICQRVKDWEIIDDISRKAGWTSGCISKGRDIFVVVAQCDGKRFSVRADEKLTTFVELEWAIRFV